MTCYWIDFRKEIRSVLPYFAKRVFRTLITRIVLACTGSVSVGLLHDYLRKVKENDSFGKEMGAVKES